LNLKKCVIKQKPKGVKIEGARPKSSSKESPNTFYNANIETKCFLQNEELHNIGRDNLNLGNVQNALLFWVKKTSHFK
jgi:hypothetical protein